jgi:hypothetical protein
MTSSAVSHELRAAFRAWASSTDADRTVAVRAIERLQTIRREIAERANHLGYAELCRKLIPQCQGECCTTLFPREITRTDLLVASRSLTTGERHLLSGRLEDCDEGGTRCPLLSRDGCMLAFEQRPITCANSYPCFASHGYWQFLQGKRQETEAIYDGLSGVLDSYGDQAR